MLEKPVILPHQDLDFSNFQVLQISIDNLYKEISAKLLDVLFQDYNLISHLDNLKRFVVLGQGDFVSYLIDALGYFFLFDLVISSTNLPKPSTGTILLQYYPQQYLKAVFLWKVIVSMLN
jgi:hypothetical protein